MQWEAVIGLEVHARLLTASKMFCGCSTSFGAPPNTQVCPVCLAYPGALPVLNRHAVELAIQMALAAGSEVQRSSLFARKNYFYPDLPKGYQISQFDRPLAKGGAIDAAGTLIRLQRIHLEEDAGKLIHEADRSLVDLNRSGTPLIEIVSEPDLRTPADAAAYLTRLRQILMYTNVCDGNMEEGSLRCDANVSIRRPGAPLGTRTEVKNVNSIRYLSWAIEFEIERQKKVLDSGGAVVQETRLFDSDAGETRPMRTKEEAHDYRYFPEPDLVTLHLDDAWIERVRGTIPELPAARSARYQKQYALAPVDAEVLVTTRPLAEFFEKTSAESGNPRAAANWVRNEVLRVLNEQKIDIESYGVTPSKLARLIRMLDGGAIGGKAAKDVFDEMSVSGGDPDEIVARKGLGQISDRDVIRDAARRILEINAVQVEQFRAGKTQIFGYLVGQLMKEMHGRANAEIANEVLRELIG